MITLLDGPLGTELQVRGVPNDVHCWSAGAIESSPEVIQQIHADYVAAGATVHTANTFRTNRRASGDRWIERTKLAVALTRAAVPSGHRVAGSIAPVEDCYRSDLSPGAAAEGEHREMAETLVAAGCDLLLCETFVDAQEAIAAVRASVRTGVETWLALTAGPDADLMTPQTMAEVASHAIQEGSTAVLVNCTPATRTEPFVRAIAERNLGVPIGAYANAGSVDDQIGWRPPSEPGIQAYVGFAQRWIEAGATVIGGCCGTGPEHIRALRSMVHETGA
ncbi:MAG: homocysteine S-methyltransferase family protein [Rubripirellula sp.]